MLWFGYGVAAEIGSRDWTPGRARVIRYKVIRYKVIRYKVILNMVKNIWGSLNN